jgi:hypothetical protein
MPRNAIADRTGGGAHALYQQCKLSEKNVAVKAEVEGVVEPVPILIAYRRSGRGCIHS